MAEHEPRMGINASRPHLSDELLLHIVSVFVPKGGICISNDLAYDVDLKTIRGLLRTNVMFRREILSRTFDNPVHVYITNGKRCRCATLTPSEKAEPSRAILKAPLGKVMRLPLQKWREGVIHFVPRVGIPARQHCPLEVQKRHTSPRKDIDLGFREMESATDCITRQSDALSDLMWKKQKRKEIKGSTTFRFAFEEWSGVDACSAVREYPLWTPRSIHGPLKSWRWFWEVLDSNTHTWIAPPVNLPTRSALGVLASVLEAVESEGFDVVAMRQARALRELFMTWWYQIWRNDLEILNASIMPQLAEPGVGRRSRIHPGIRENFVPIVIELTTSIWEHG